MTDAIILDRDDVRITVFQLNCEECEEAPATCIVSLNLRSAGQEFTVAQCCADCGVELVERIRECIPATMASRLAAAEALLAFPVEHLATCTGLTKFDCDCGRDAAHAAYLSNVNSTLSEDASPNATDSVAHNTTKTGQK